MSKQEAFDRRRNVCFALALTMTVLPASGCCSVTPTVGKEGRAVEQPATAAATPILVTLVAEEGEALATGRERVLGQLRSVMCVDAFSTVRVYETLPIVALNATPKVVALLLTLPEVRHIERDKDVKILKLVNFGREQ